MPRSYDRDNPPPRKKILVAAEEPGHCRFEEATLRRVGHTVITTTQMARVLDLAKAEAVDLLLVDLYAPKHPDPRVGCEVVKAIRADPSVTHLPVILLYPPGADAQYHPRNWCPLPADACTFLRKPPNPVELWALVDDPKPGEAHRHQRFVYRPGDWPEIEPAPRRPWWRWWSRQST
jgi:CheY-like chemotaxis protein